MSNLTPAMIDMLTTQYVWTVQNDSEWYRVATEAYDCGWQLSFASACSQAIKRVEKDRGERLTAELTDWVINELRTRYMQDNAHKPVPKSFLQYLKAEIAEHTAKAEAILNKVEEDLQTAIIETKEKTMNNVPFATRHEVYGQDTKTMTEPQLIDAIKKIEAEIANLGQVKTKSKKIEAKVAELTTMLASVVEVLDAL